jgi:protein-tyrosine-phosphatase
VVADVVKRIVPFKDRLRHRRKLILFICTGNTCRSPMAAGYMKKLLEERGIREIDVRSAGVMTTTGLLASAEAIQVLDAENVDLRRHRSSPLTPEVIRKADLILAMSPFHRQSALRLSEEARSKTYMLKEFVRSDLKNAQIADPMGCTLEVFKKTFKEIKQACNKLIEHEYIIGKRGGESRPVTTLKKANPPKGTSAETAKPAKTEKSVAEKAAKAAKPAAKAPAKPAAKKAKPVAKAKPAAKPAGKSASKPAVKPRKK